MHKSADYGLNIWLMHHKPKKSNLLLCRGGVTELICLL